MVVDDDDQDSLTLHCGSRSAGWTECLWRHEGQIAVNISHSARKSELFIGPLYRGNLVLHADHLQDCSISLSNVSFLSFWGEWNCDMRLNGGKKVSNFIQVVRGATKYSSFLFLQQNEPLYESHGQLLISNQSQLQLIVGWNCTIWHQNGRLRPFNLHLGEEQLQSEPGSRGHFVTWTPSLQMARSFHRHPFQLVISDRGHVSSFTIKDFYFAPIFIRATQAPTSDSNKDPITPIMEVLVEANPVPKPEEVLCRNGPIIHPLMVVQAQWKIRILLFEKDFSECANTSLDIRNQIGSLSISSLKFEGLQLEFTQSQFGTQFAIALLVMFILINLIVHCKPFRKTRIWSKLRSVSSSREDEPISQTLPVETISEPSSEWNSPIYEDVEDIEAGASEYDRIDFVRPKNDLQSHYIHR